MSARIDERPPCYHQVTPLPLERVDCGICPAVTDGASFRAQGWTQVTLDNGWVVWMCKGCNANPQLNPR